jgi:WD40 repeat protein
MTIGDTSQFVVSTEDGELAMCDWGSGKKDDDDDGGKKKVVKNVYRCHYLNATALQKSPHFPDLYLTVGDWSFHIWKLGMDVPLFSSPFADENVLSGCWSPTRPAVIVIALADGTVHFWDLLDQSHRPTAVQSVSSNAISSLRFCPPAHSLQYLAAADSQGDLHILEIPRNLRRKLAGEEELMSHFYQREVDRVNYYRNLTPLPPPAQPGSKPKNEEKVEQNDTSAADDKAELDYQKQLLKFQQELGLVKGGGGDD